MISTYDNTFDAAGRRTETLENTGDRVTWAYDAAGQLTADQRSGTAAYDHSFTCDPVGNRLTKQTDGAIQTSTYDAADQLLTVEDSTGTTQYSFDANGNQHAAQNPSGAITTWSWDYENQNRLVQLPDGNRVTMVFDADNRLVSKAT